MPSDRAGDDGGAAFPQFEVAAGERDGHGDAIEAFTVATGGMKLRDYFAAKVLQGCLAYSHHNETWGDYHNNSSDSSLAEHCYRVADAMITARKSGAGPDEARALARDERGER